MKLSRQIFAGTLLAVTLIFVLGAANTTMTLFQERNALYPYQELIEQSQKEKKGLTFFIKGQTIGGLVTKVIGSGAVEVRNQTYSRVIIRLDQVDAVAIN